MSYDPREIALLRQAIVAEQMKPKRRGRGKKCDGEMEGGFLGSLAKIASRFVPSAAKTAARSTAIVPYSASRAAANLASAASKTKPSFLTRFTPSLRTTASLGLNFGLPLGFTAYQIADYAKTKEAQAAADKIYQAESDAVINKEVERLNSEIALLEAQRQQEGDVYTSTMAQLDQQSRDYAKAQADYAKAQADAERQYMEQMKYQQSAPIKGSVSGSTSSGQMSAKQRAALGRGKYRK
jgi:hypothetical protein